MLPGCLSGKGHDPSLPESCFYCSSWRAHRSALLLFLFGKHTKGITFFISLRDLSCLYRRQQSFHLFGGPSGQKAIRDAVRVQTRLQVYFNNLGSLLFGQGWYHAGGHDFSAGSDQEKTIGLKCFLKRPALGRLRDGFAKKHAIRFENPAALRATRRQGSQGEVSSRSPPAATEAHSQLHIAVKLQHLLAAGALVHAIDILSNDGSDHACVFHLCQGQVGCVGLCLIKLVKESGG